MAINKLTGAIIIAGVLLIGVTAIAMGPGQGQGSGSGMMGSGHSQGSGMMGQGMGMMGQGMGMMGRGFTGQGMTGSRDGSGWDNQRPNTMPHEETGGLQSEIVQRRAQLRDLLAEDEVDIAQVKAVQGEINRLEEELAARRPNMNGSRGSGLLPRLLNRWR